MSPADADLGAPDRNSYDVIVVGAGTTGLVLARLLTMQGARVALVDPNRILCQHPRASHIDDECMRIAQTVGLADHEPGYLVMGGFEVWGDDDRLLLNWNMSQGETDQGWQSDYQFFQPDFEAAVRGKLAGCELADLWLGWRVATFEQDARGVSVFVENRRTGESVAMRGDYVVGCDGANSVIRERVVNDVEDLQGTQRSMIVDVEKFTSLEALPTAATYIKVGPRPFTHQPASNGISRFQFMLLGDEDVVENLEDPQTVYSLLDPYLPPDSYRIMRTDTYEWHARLMHGWRSGRVLVAGDAAHQMPPALGQGMCSGMRDAANLAWKLRLVLGGTAPSSLLDSYEQERGPHVRAMIIESTRQAKVIAAAGRGERVEATGSVDRTRGRLGNRAGAPTSSYPLSGQLSAQPRRDDGTLVDDIVGYNFAVIGKRSTIEAVDEGTRRIWKELDVAVVTDLPAADRWLAGSSADAVLVRPDRYVFAAVHGPEQLNGASALLGEECLMKEHKA